MIITYYGKQFFKLQVGDTAIAFDPISKNSKQKTTRFGVDVGLISLNHEDYNGVENLSHGEKEPVIISGPGEYEIKDIFIKGVGVEVTHGGEKKINTIYLVKFEGITLCFLGALANAASLTSDVKSKLKNVEILFVPIGGGDVLDPHEAYTKVAVPFDANVIIPMNYDADGKNDPLTAFLKEAGNGNEALDKLTIKKKDLASKEAEVIVLKPSIS